MRRALVAGNWKMYGSRSDIAELLNGIVAGLDEAVGGSGEVDIAVCPPFTYLDAVQARLRETPIAWGAQNLCEHAGPGAYTGEVSGAMLQDFGCRYVIVGHSERRTLYHESDDLVAQKCVTALDAGLIPVICVGELLEERESGKTEAIVGRQLEAVFAALDDRARLADAVIAYEPVWAIGTGKTATPEQAQAAHEFIRRTVAAEDKATADGLRILYGGSVKAGNAAELFSMADIDGGLIGGASLKAEDFLAICRAAGQG
jgi:triosephosphate isomerase (TIM)